MMGKHSLREAKVSISHQE